MNGENRRLAIAGILAAAGLLAMTGCGGGEAQRVTVAKVLEPGEMSLFPPEGASDAAVQELTRLGVASLGKKCGLLKQEFADGTPYLTVGGTSTRIVLVEIDVSDMGRASQVGYVDASGDYMKSVSDTFDCKSRSM